MKTMKDVLKANALSFGPVRVSLVIPSQPGNRRYCPNTVRHLMKGGK